MNTRQVLRFLMLGLPALCACAEAGAQAPTFTKPIRLVVPFTAGGGVDVIARALAEGARPGRAPVLRGPGAAIDCSRKLRRASPRPDFRHSISALELQHGARNQASRKSEIANVLDSKGKVIAA